MKKAQLIKEEPLKATQTMLDMARTDVGVTRCYKSGYYTQNYTEYQTFLYFRARLQGEILEVDVYTRAELALGKKTPVYRIFLDKEKKEFATYDEAGWKTAKIDNLDYGKRNYFQKTPREQAESRDVRMVNDYFSTGCHDAIYKAVRNFQHEVRRNVRQEKYRCETEAIDEVMNTVPDTLPADFTEWIRKTAFRNKISMFYLSREKKAWCEGCGEHIALNLFQSEPKHLQIGKCPSCGCKVTFRSWNKQSVVNKKIEVGILQKCNDGKHIIYRQFDVRKRLEKEKDYVPEINMYEEYRENYTYEMQKEQSYEWGEFRQSDVYRWCRYGTVNHGGYYWNEYARETAVIYTKNLTRLLKDTGLRYIPLADILREAGSVKLDSVIYELRTNSIYEKLYKAGLRRLTIEMLKKNVLTKLEYSGNKIWNKLKVDRNVFKQAVRLNVTDVQMRILQLLYAKGRTVTDKELKWLDANIGANNLLNHAGKQTMHRIIRYIQANNPTGEEQERRDMLQTWNDYLDIADTYNWNLYDRSIFFPQNLTRAHDEIVKMDLIEKDKKEKRDAEAKDKALRKLAKDIARLFGNEDDDYFVMVPQSREEFLKEAQMQHNCVASRYYDMAVNGETIILFVRRKSAPEESFCTVEVKKMGGEFQIIQNYTAYNKPAPEDEKAFLKKTVKEAQKRWDKERRRKVKVQIAAAV